MSIPPLRLGFDNYAIRALGWKAPRLLEHAASLKLDLVLFSDPDVYEHQSEAYLREIRARADDLGLAIHVGMLSICPSSVRFEPGRGTAEEQLQRTIRTAQILGSPVARCVLGDARDRSTPGGIPARMAETVQVLHNVRQHALDAGVKIALENHAGDMQSWELVALIEEAGLDFVGATMDSGNAPWALEDPAESLEILAPYALTSGIRDSALWEVENGAILQWTAMGDGCVDWLRYFERFAQLCPNTPVVLETISGRPIPIPYWQEGFWDAYPAARIPEFMKFLAIARAGTPRPLVACAADSAPAAGRQQYQLDELARSVAFCQQVLGVSRESHDG